MQIKNIVFGVLLLTAPSITYAFPAPEAMGAISFALSSIWAHLSAIFGSVLGIRGNKIQDSNSIKKAYMFFLSLMLLSIGINAIQFYLASDRLTYSNEVNFQKVQPVPFPNVRQEFHSTDHLYSIDPDYYFNNQKHYVLYPVVTKTDFEKNFTAEFKDSTKVVIINSHGHITNSPYIPDGKKVVLGDWNGDLSRIAINHAIKSKNTNYLWLEGGYQTLLKKINNEESNIERIDPSLLSTYDKEKNTLFIDVTERHAFDERGYYYSALNRPYPLFFSGELDISDISSHDGPVVFLDFYESKSKAAAVWYQKITGKQAYILDGGYEHLTEQKLDWIPFYPNRYRLLSEQQVYDWYIGTDDVVFMDGRSSSEHENSKEKWLTISTPVEYDNLDELYNKVRTLDKTKRYAGFVYDQGNAFKMLVLGYALHKEGYTWLGLYTRPEFLSFAEIDDFSKNRPHRIEIWKDKVEAGELYPRLLSDMKNSFDIPIWLFLACYGFVFRMFLTPITYWTSQPLLLRRTLSKRVQALANIIYIGVLIGFAILMQRWFHDFGDSHWSFDPITKTSLLENNLILTLITTGLIGVQMSLTPGLHALSTAKRKAFSIIGLGVISYFLFSLAGGMLIYICGITLASTLLSAIETVLRDVRHPSQRKDLPIITSKSKTIDLTITSDANQGDHGIKAGRLGEIYRKGYNVPLFICLKYFEFKKIDTDQSSLDFYRFISRLGDRLIIRSSSLGEDSSASNIGRFDSKLIRLSNLDPDGLIKTLSSVFDSQYRESEYDRQVIIQQFVVGESYLVATSRDLVEPKHSRIEYGDHESVTEGCAVKSELGMDITSVDTDTQKIHKLIRELEVYFKEPVDVELSIKQNIPFILQVRPLHPLKFCNPYFYESLTNKLSGIEEETINKASPISDAGETPSVLSISILKALYGNDLIVWKGIPYVLPTKKVRSYMSYEDLRAKLIKVSNDTSRTYETILFISLDRISDDSLIAYYKDCFKILQETMKISEQLRISKRLEKKIVKSSSSLGYWSEDQKELTGVYQSPSFFLGKADFDVRTDLYSKYDLSDLVKPLNNLIPKHTRVITDVHYMTSRTYTAISLLLNEIDNRVNKRFDSNKWIVLGMTHKEIIEKRWDTPSLWENRSKALRVCQDHDSSDSAVRSSQFLNQPKQVTIVKPDNINSMDEISENSLLILDYGRSDIIPEMEKISAIICKKGGENSHWMMVAKSFGIYAISGDSTLKTEEWEHGCKVTLLH